MNVYPFRKRPSLGRSGKIWQEDLILGRNSDLDLASPPIPHKEDFSREIEITCANDALIAVLRSRSGEPAIFSLQDVKRRFELEF